MPTVTHAVLIDRVNDAIKFQLNTIARSSSRLTAAIAQEVRNLRSSDMYFPSGDKRSPDSQWSSYNTSGQPLVIIETSYSQRPKNLARLADDYIMLSRGAIRMVVGIDIEYRGTKEARMMVWERQVVAEGSETFLESKLISNEVSTRGH